ncbi:MAG: DUF4838 domain-containing protein [Oscillospiraceae bacterium]|nr:DUF4838 domain-containing protein [Oscillospiraceae bacterium]
MTKFRRIIILVFILSMMLSIAGCDSDSNTADAGRPVVDGQYLASNGETEYKIVIPENASSLIQIAVSDFNKFFFEATGVSMPVVKDSEFNGDGKFISVGETTLLKNTEITYSFDELGRDGYKIITEGDDLYLIGGADYGSMYASYELLGILVDWDYFAQDSYVLTKGLTQLPLYDLNVTDVPDFPIRVASDGVVETSNQALYRLRQRPLTENFIFVKNHWAHNSIQFIKDSPDVNDTWYNAAKTQLCYTAHGDAQQYEKMQNACFETLKEALIQTPDRDAVTFTIEDNSDYCDCDACNAMKAQYGALSSTVILFLNDLNARVRAWFETEEGKPYARNLRIVFFAYNAFEAAPATYNSSTGKYEPNNGIKMDDGVYCMLAPIRMDYYRPITDPLNQEYYTNLKSWGDLAQGNLYLWYYSTNFWNYHAPYDCFDSFAENYRMAAECNAYYLFDQRQVDERTTVTGWSTLKDYVCSKLGWDVDRNPEELIDKFFEGYFGPAAPEMRVIFDQLRLLTEYNKEYNEMGGNATIYLSLTDEKFWPKDVLQQWMVQYDLAVEKIAPLKESNPALYESYLEHIQKEKISTLYLLVECYSYNTSVTLIDAYKAEFKELADKLGVTKYHESSDISNLYDKWF